MNNVDDFPHDCGGVSEFHVNGASADARRKEIEAIFGDPQLLNCLDALLANTDEPTDPETAKARRLEALAAFSANPPEFWDMDD